MPAKRKRSGDDEEEEDDEGDNEGDNEGGSEQDEGDDDDVMVLSAKVAIKPEAVATPKPAAKAAQPKAKDQSELATWEEMMKQTSLKGTTKSKKLKTASIENLAIRNELAALFAMYVDLSSLSNTVSLYLSYRFAHTTSIFLCRTTHTNTHTHTHARIHTRAQTHAHHTYTHVHTTQHKYAYIYTHTHK